MLLDNNCLSLFSCLSYWFNAIIIYRLSYGNLLKEQLLSLLGVEHLRLQQHILFWQR